MDVRDIDRETAGIRHCRVRPIDAFPIIKLPGTQCCQVYLPVISNRRPWRELLKTRGIVHLLS